MLFTRNVLTSTRHFGFPQSVNLNYSTSRESFSVFLYYLFEHPNSTGQTQSCSTAEAFEIFNPEVVEGLCVFEK